jgi:hypothetical protein
MGNAWSKTVAEAQRASKRLPASVYGGAVAGSEKGDETSRVVVGGLGRLDHPALRRRTARLAVPGQPGLRTDDRGPRRLRTPGTRMS